MSSFHPDLMRELRALLSEKEMTKFGGMWGQRIKTSPRAVAYAIEDLKLRKDNYHKGIKNRGAWLSNRYTTIKNKLPKTNFQKHETENAEGNQ